MEAPAGGSRPRGPWHGICSPRVRSTIGASTLLTGAYAKQERNRMNWDLPQRPHPANDDSFLERLAEVLRRILVPGAPRLVPVPVPVPVRDPVVRRRA